LYVKYRVQFHAVVEERMSALQPTAAEIFPHSQKCYFTIYINRNPLPEMFLLWICRKSKHQ